jgi:hypothetical protein
MLVVVERQPFCRKRAARHPPQQQCFHENLVNDINAADGLD